jgi:hypothetical protein
MSSPYTLCLYIGRKGLCNKRCFGGRCNIHRKRETLTLCVEDCGRGTASQTGYCAQCGYKQIYYGNKLKRERDQRNAFLNELLGEIYAEMDEAQANNLLCVKVSAVTISDNKQ